jgi:predicted porin
MFSAPLLASCRDAIATALRDLPFQAIPTRIAKKIWITSGLLCIFPALAAGQNSVTVFGVMDINVTHVSAGGNPEGSRTFIDTGGINSSRLGFRGTEDMGGGLSAGFWLEAGIQPQNGSGSSTSVGNGATYPGTATGGGGLTFNRRATVSLLDARLGELRLGRDDSATYYNLDKLDPFNFNSIAQIGTLATDPQSAAGPTIARTSNQVAYLTPNTLGGFFALADVALGGNPDNLVNAEGQNLRDVGNYAGLELGYLNGPWYAAIATTVTHASQTLSTLHIPEFPADAQGTGAGLNYGLGTGEIHVTNLGLTYNFGWIRPDVFFQSGRVDAAPRPYGTDVASIGALIQTGLEQFRISYVHATGEDFYSGSHANLYGLGYVHLLSTRTAFYVIYARVSNSGAYAFSLNGYTPTPAPGGASSGIQLGVRTSF